MAAHRALSLARGGGRVTQEVFVKTCFQCPFGRVEADSHAVGATFDCMASRFFSKKPLTIRLRNYEGPPPEACPLRAPNGVVLRVAGTPRPEAQS